MWTLRVAAMVVVVAGDMNTTVPSQLSLQSCVCPDGRQGSSYEGPFSCRSHMPIPGVPPAEAPPDFGISVGEMTLQTCIDVCASWASVSVSDAFFDMNCILTRLSAVDQSGVRG